MRTKLLTRAAAVVLLSIAATACGSDDDDDAAASSETTTADTGGDTATTAGGETAEGTCEGGDPIVIGVVMPETGDFGSVGTEAVVGAESAVTELNESGGVLGCEVQLEVRDSGSNANQGILAVQELIDNFDPAFMIPDTISSIAQGTQPITTDAHIPTASAASAPDLGNAETFPYHFQAFINSTQQAEAVYAGLQAKDVTKAGILTSSDAAGVAVADSAADQLPDYGFEVVGSESFEPGSTDLTVQLQRLKSAGAEGLVVHAIGADNGTIMQAVADLGWDDVVVVADASSLAGNLAEIIPADVQDQFFTLSARALLQGQSATDLYETFSAEGEIQSLQVPAINHDIIILAAWAMEEAGSTDPDAVKEALESLDGRPDSDLPDLAYFPNPGWSPTVHNLSNADLSDFWALVSVAPPVDGAYEGEPLTITPPTGN